MKISIILGLGLFSLIYNLSQTNFFSFLQEVNLLVFWNGIIVSDDNSILVLFDMIISGIFLVNPYRFDKIFMMFGV